MADTVGAAQLAITADATGVEAGVSRAKKSLATLGGAAKSAGTEASKGTDKIGEGADKASGRLDRATKQMIASIQRTTATLESGSRSSSKFFETLAQQRGVDVNALKPYLQQLDAASAKQVAAANAAKVVAPAITQVGLSAKQTTAALRQVPAQFTDIVTSLVAGQNPMQVFIQQGGQLKDVFGGIGPAARALGGYLAGLINPFTLAAGAVAVLGLAYFQGAKEAQAFTRAVILSGNASGVTVGQLTEMSERIDDITGTQRAAAAALAEVVQSGQIAGESIERFTVIALRMEKETGQAVSETVKQFVELGKSPVEASAKLNEATNFLTASVARQIRILEEQGRAADAARLAQETYANTLETRLNGIESNLGLVERMWRAVGSAAKEAWDFMLNVGRPDSIEQQLAGVMREIEKARGPFDPSAFGGNAEARARLPELQEQSKRLQRMLEIQRGNAAAQADQAKLTRAQLEWDKEGEQVLDKKVRLEREITKARELGLRAGISQAEIDQRVAAIREKFADKGAGRAALRIDRAELGLDIEGIRNEAEQMVAVYSRAERRVESLRKQGILSDREYYESKRSFINLDSQAKEAGLQQEIARLQQEKLTGADRLANDKKIADAQARLAILRADTSSRLVEISEEQAMGTKREAAEFAAARTAAEEYFQAIARVQDRELAGRGRGRRQREFDRGNAGITDRFDAERSRLESGRAAAVATGTFNDDERRRYEARLALLDEFQARELAAWQEFNQRKVAAEQDWTIGAKEALYNYADATKNVASDVEAVFTNAFGGLEDAIAQFAQTGKLSIKDLVRSILADIARLQARKVTGMLAKAIAGAIGGGISGTASGADWDIATSNMDISGRAIGGPVSAGRMYEVNERGRPELLNVGGKQWLMMGSQPGHVSPNGGSGSGSGSISIVNNLSEPIGKVTEQRTSDGDRVLVLERAMVEWLADPNSRVSRQLAGSTTASRRR